MQEIEVYIKSGYFLNFLFRKKKAMRDNSLTIARSKNYNNDGLKFVIDYDKDRYCLRIEDFESSDLRCEHIYEHETTVAAAQSIYDSMIAELENLVRNNELKQCPRCRCTVNTRKIENDLRLEIDTLLLDMSFDEGEKLKELCNGSDAELNDAYWNYDDELVSVRPNIDGLRKYLAAIKVVRNIN